MNGYNFEFAVSAIISAKVAEEMIKKVVEEQTGKRVFKITTKMSNVTRGIGPSEFTETVFDGFTVLFENEKSNESKTSGFVKDKY